MSQRASHERTGSTGRPQHAEHGFTLIEIIIVVAIIAIIAAVAVPNLFSARSAANEVSAIATLRTIYQAQAQFQSSAVVDSDGDGLGEFGCLGELAGALPLDARGPGAARRLEPPFIGSAFQRMEPGGYVMKSGYAFQIWLPDLNGAGVTEAPGAVPPGLDPDFGESFWFCYAWPVNPGSSGRRAFALNQSGMLVSTTMAALEYDGNNPPAWNAAMAAGAISMDESFLQGVAARDANVWTLVRGQR